MRKIARLLVIAAWLALPLRAAEGGFVRNGVFPYIETSAVPAGLALYGSWVGGDVYQGSQESPWVPAREHVGLLVSGYPTLPGLFLQVEWRLKDGTVATTRFAQDHPREKWRPWILTIPPDSVSMRWVAEDRSSAASGWLGVSDFVDPRWHLAFASLRTRALVWFAAIGAFIGLFGLAVSDRIRRALEPGTDAPTAQVLTPIVATLALALAGYLLFWVWFFSAKAGLVASILFLLTVVLLGARELRRKRWEPSVTLPWGLAALVGGIYLVLLLLPPAQSFHHAAQNRFAGLPPDNELPGFFAARLLAGESPKGSFGDWLSSDRPPLQTGWDLIFCPWLKPLGAEYEMAAGLAGVWLQLAWIPCLWAVFPLLGLSRRQTVLATLAVAVLGFMLVNSIYVWPKLSSAGFTIIGALLCLRLREPSPARLSRLAVLGGVFLALGWLSHGASAFALIGLVPLVLFDRPGWRGWFQAGIAFCVCGLPWVLYQKLYDPPGNRLIKWHLAGYLPVDARGVTETLVAQYRQVGWDGALNARRENLQMQGQGEWLTLFDFKPSPFRKYVELAFYLRSAGLYLLVGVVCWGALLFGKNLRRGLDLRLCGQAFLWMLATWIAWLALMFIPLSAVAHQGTYVIPLLLYILLLTATFKVLGRLAPVILLVQSVYFFVVWTPVDNSYYESLPDYLRPARLAPPADTGTAEKSRDE